MKRWGPACLIAALACIAILLNRSSSPLLLQDSDTAVALDAIQKRGNPWSWFVGDWPLENHFYRPISTLAFELDLALHGRNDAGFGLTNALLCTLCSALLFWVIREFTDKPWFAAGSSVLFSLWTLDYGARIAWIFWALCLIALVSMFLPKRRLIQSAAAAMIFGYLAFEVGGIVDLRSRMIDWIPGRTASVMTVFCLAAIAAYLRFERLTAERAPTTTPGPLDPPATRNTVLNERNHGPSWIWAIASLLSVALALGSYEQAVMLPGVLIAFAVGMRLQGFRTRWWVPAGAFALLAGYLVLRREILPSDVSGYQAQQLRDGPGVFLDLASFAFPGGPIIWQSMQGFDLALLVLPTTYKPLFTIVANVVAYTRMRLKPPLAIVGLIAAFLAYLPMAWLKVFHHYYYWPMALRSAFVIGLIALGGQALISAASRPTIQAPVRRDPAPGSLAHQ